MARNTIIPIFVPHLGCPNQCVFCNQRRISGSLLPARDSDVAAALREAEEKGVRGAQLAFYGGSFTAIPAAVQERLLSAAEPYLAGGVLRSVRLSTRPDAIDENVLQRLKRYGVSTVELGSQSMDDGVLMASGRGHTAADTVHAAAQIKAAGMELVLQMMTGLPASSPEKDVETARRIIACRPDAVRIYPTVIVRDTPLFDMWQAETYREHTVEDAVQVCADILPLFEEAGIPVIRLGLNPTQELSSGQAAGGAYHPALGELVRSERLRRQTEELLREVPHGSKVTVAVAPERVSAMIGQHGANREAICRDLGLAALKILPDKAAGEKVLCIDVIG